MNDDESLRVCDNCRGCGQDGDPPDANGEGGWIGACEKCQGRGLLDWGDTDVVGAEILVLRASLTARENALRDFAEHGLRFDLTPTHNLAYTQTRDGLDAAHFWHTYIKRMDASVRERAQEALK